MILRYSGRSKPSALLIAEASGGLISAVREGVGGDVNWGRAQADTKLNPDISNVTNKRRMRELFKEHDVPMPHLYSSVRFPATLGEPLQYPIIGRPDQHSKGRGFWKIHNNDELRKALAGTRRKRAATHFMEYVDAPREYRVHIFKGKSIRISEKTFYVDELTKEVDKSTYYTSKPRHEIGHVRSAAKKAVAAVGLDFGAVDILADENDCWVLEVNAAPGLGGSMPKLYADTFLAWKRGEWDDR